MPASQEKSVIQLILESLLFLCNMSHPITWKRFFLFLIIMGCTWAILNIVHYKCSTKLENKARQIPNIQNLEKVFFSGRNSQGMGNSWCRNKTKQLDGLMANLTGKDIKADDPQLIKALRQAGIDPPSPYLAKMSLPLFKTPQAETVEKITKGMVIVLLIFIIFSIKSTVLMNALSLDIYFYWIENLIESIGQSHFSNYIIINLPSCLPPLIHLSTKYLLI